MRPLAAQNASYSPQVVRLANGTPNCLTTDMSDVGKSTKGERAVGDVVQVTRSKGTVVTGTIVEDYADVVRAVGDDLGRDWARPHRWAVALDTGVLVFVDDDDLVVTRALP